MKYTVKAKEELIKELMNLHKQIEHLKREKLKLRQIENELKIQKSALTERVKELNCLYNISKILGQKSLSLTETMQKLIQIIIPAWQYQDCASARIIFNDLEFKSSNFKNTQWVLKNDLIVFNKKVGFIEVCYLENVFRKGEESFLPAEKKLLKAIAEVVGNIIEQKEIDKNMKESSLKLQKQKKELEEKNIALKELIAQIELEKKEIKNQILSNVNYLILPTIGKLKSSTPKNSHFSKYIEILLRNLKEITSPFSKRIIDNRAKLSPKEFEICNLVKNGLTNKEIADLLYISVLTVERHRHNIRKKLGISHQKVNLSTFLQNFQ